MKALKMVVVIGQDHKLTIDVPNTFQEGPAELILLAPEAPNGDASTDLETHIHQLLANPHNRDKAGLDREIETQRRSWE